MPRLCLYSLTVSDRTYTIIEVCYLNLRGDMKKILYIIFCAAFISVGAGMIRAEDARSAKPPVIAASITEKTIIDSETAKIAAEWKEKNKAPEEVIRVANEGFVHFLEVVGETPFNDWKVTSKSLQSASLGVPFQVYKITLDALRSYHKGDTVKSLISETNIWCFPVLVGKEIKLTLEVGKLRSNGKWVAGSLKGGHFENELNQVVQRWPKVNGYNPVLVKIDKLDEYLFTVPEKDMYNLTQISSAPFRKKHIVYPNLDTVSNVVEWATPEVEANVRHENDLLQKQVRPPLK